MAKVIRDGLGVSGGVGFRLKCGMCACIYVLEEGDVHQAAADEELAEYDYDRYWASCPQCRAKNWIYCEDADAYDLSSERHRIITFPLT